MKISEASAHSGLSISTIRYYENTGLCPFITRAPDGRRRFTQRDIDWLKLLASLRATGMPLAQMRAFAALYAEGDDKILERKATLIAHKDTLNQRQADLDRCRAILDHKLHLYDDILQGQSCA